jgi:hypothetical protein
MLRIDEADVIAMDSARSALNSEHHQLNKSGEEEATHQWHQRAQPNTER